MLLVTSLKPRAVLTPLSCSPNFPRARYLDIRTLTHELIVKYGLGVEVQERGTSANGTRIRRDRIESISKRFF